MCGIAGFIGSHKKDHFMLFNPIALHFLMVSQDTRGRDNCGIYYRGLDADKKVRELIQWGHGKDSVGSTKTFEEFLKKKKSSMLEYAPPFKMIAHSRKASAGSEILDNAHPFHHGNIIGVHNGTLTDWRNLMKDLEVDIDDIDVDSSAIFKAFSEGKTIEFLKSYTGAAALMWTELNDKKDIIKVWVGKSEDSSPYEYAYSTAYSKKKDEIERPLHYMETPAGYYISSEAGPLEKIKMLFPVGFEGGDILHFKPNAITTFENGKIVNVQEIERNIKKDVFTKKTETGTTRTILPTQNRTTTPISTKEIKKVNLLNGVKNGGETEGLINPRNFYTPEIHNGRYYRSGVVMDSNLRFGNPICNYEVEQLKQEGFFASNRFFINSDDNHFYYLNLAAKKYTRADSSFSLDLDHPNIKEYFFYKGVMLNSKEGAVKLFKLKQAAIDKIELMEPVAEEISKFAAMPVPSNIGWDTDTSKLFLDFGIVQEGKIRYYSGNFNYPFTNSVYFFSEGLVDNKTIYQDSLFELNSRNKLHEFREKFTGKMVTFVIPDIVQKDKWMTQCPSCGTKHFFTNEELEKVPHCFSCNELLVIHESVEKDLENNYENQSSKV